MKHYVAIFTVIAFTTAVLGFGILSGPAALVCRAVFMATFAAAVTCLAMAGCVRKRREHGLKDNLESSPQEPPAC